MQITTYTAPVTFAAVTHHKSARSGAEIIDRVVTATATVEEIRLFMSNLGDKLTTEEVTMAQYAGARALYRAGESLNIRQLALLAEVSVKSAQHYLKRANRVARMNCIANTDVSRVLTMIADK
jgi:hypothetical protein